MVNAHSHRLGKRRGRRKLRIFVVAVVATVTLAHAAEVRAQSAPDVVVLCDVSLREALVAAAQTWRAGSGVPVRILPASLEQNAQLVVHGTRADLLIGIGSQRIDNAQQLGALQSAAPVVIGRDPVVLAIRGPVTQPRRLGPGDEIGGLLAEGRFGLVDTAIGSAGADARTALTAVGLWPSLEARSVGTATPDGLRQLLSDGDVRIAALYQSDLAASPALSVAATIPGQAPPVIAALTKDTQSPDAKSFLAFLAADGQTILRQNGLEGP